MTAPIGRLAELEHARAFLEAAHQRFAVLLLEGEAGIGKTVIFDEVLRLAQEQGQTVLVCRGAQAETKLAHSALTDLMESVPSDVLDALPAPQRRALDVALLRTDPGDEPVGERALSAAVRSVMVALAQTGPILLAVDDVQWLDAPSAGVLGYVLRRLSTEPIGLLATRRSGEPAAMKLEALVRPGIVDRLEIRPMSIGAMHQLIREQLGYSLARPMLLRVHQASDGNPLFALEICRMGRGGLPEPGQPLPVPSDVETLVRTRVMGLPEDARDVLLTAAALAEPRVRLVCRVAGRTIEAELELAANEDIAKVEGDVIRFRHPLFGSAIYASFPASARRDLHRRLASMVDDPEERARHLALAVEDRDEETARAVHAIAIAASRRGAPAAAVELLEHAMAVGEPDSATEAERVYDLAHNLALVGDNQRALELLERVDPSEGWPANLQGRALELMLELTYWTHGPGPELDRLGVQLLARELPDAALAHVHGGLAQYTEHDLPRALEHADAALEILDRLGDDADPRARSSMLAYRVRNRLVLGEGLDRDGMRQALALEARSAPKNLRREASEGFGQWLKYADDVDGSRALLETGLAQTLDIGYEKGALNALQHLALTECLAGNLELARDHAQRAVELYDLERSRVLGYAHAILAIVEAHRGDADAVYALRDRYRAQAAPIHLMAALGLLELSRGRDSEAFDQLSQGMEAAAAAGLREPGIHRLHANAAEAAVALGDVARAEAIAAELEDHGRRVGHRWSLATGARCRALVLAFRGDVDGALAAADEAMHQHASLPMPFESARSLLVRGVIERRGRRRGEAYRSLVQAAEAFERMGARVWAGRARLEAERVGLRRSSGDELTEGELRCAELAASGMTNREVAAALFISPKTVEANLARAYRKLGITSRAELGSRMREYQ